MARTVANIYEDTRELLNQIKEEYDFKSDDQAIKFLCNFFQKEKFSETLKQYLTAKKKEQEG